MATIDEVQRLKDRFDAAMVGYDNEDHPQQRRWELGELVLEDQLPLVLRLRASTFLAVRVGGRFPQETYRLAAEQIWRELSAILSGSTSGPEDREIEERYIADFRKVLDVLAENASR
jgi:hypothetical protein